MTKSRFLYKSPSYLPQPLRELTFFKHIHLWIIFMSVFFLLDKKHKMENKNRDF